MNEKQYAELKTDICWIKKTLSNHLHSHLVVTIALLGITGTAVVSLLVLLLTK